MEEVDGEDIAKKTTVNPYLGDFWREENDLDFGDLLCHFGAY